MARPKEFEPQIALERAMDVFWRKGFEATSVQDLVNEMGINRASLYSTFGDKHSLFMAALDRYSESVTGPMVEQLQAEGPAKEVISGLFRSLVGGTRASEAQPGCLMTNSAVELCQRCPETAERVTKSMERVSKGFAKVVARGQEAGEIPTSQSPRALGRFLCGALQGLVVLSKANQSRAVLSDYVGVVLSVLET
ncbi:MAG: TetR/AcrR family transcriptional regulator [Planctomycetes bacterium]|nr:TetR/AcrR family transcriptional regulator [Planctomycetota bacterium]